MAHKGHAANKKRSLQTKKMCCKQKTIAANKKDVLQTKNDRCKKKKDALQTKNAVVIWPVTGQGFQNAKWPAVRYFQ